MTDPNPPKRSIIDRVLERLSPQVDNSYLQEHFTCPRCPDCRARL